MSVRGRSFQSTFLPSPTLLVVTMKPDRKSTRLNSSHTVISYAVFCLKKKKIAHSSTLALPGATQLSITLPSAHPPTLAPLATLLLEDQPAVLPSLTKRIRTARPDVKK